MADQATNQLAEKVYDAIRSDIFDFRLLPGDRFTETEMARRHHVSRTPVRDALYRLKREGYLEVAFRSGWSVAAFDFDKFDELYEFRTLIELAAVERLCRRDPAPEVASLQALWTAAEAEGVTDARRLSAMDEQFHTTLVGAAGNREMTLVHAQITDRIRIMRRLDFLRSDRVEAFYTEHPAILEKLQARQSADAATLLRAHITRSLEEVRKITMGMLFQARAQAGSGPARS